MGGALRVTRWDDVTRPQTLRAEMPRSRLLSVLSRSLTAGVCGPPANDYCEAGWGDGGPKRKVASMRALRVLSPACPTYNRLGDENDSPRGRLHLMQAVVEGRLDPESDAFQVHIDRCLGCRACEPVCPSGVEYGTLLELARETASNARASDALTRGLLTVMASRTLREILFLGGRTLRAGLASVMVSVLGRIRFADRLRFALAMPSATRPSVRLGQGVMADGMESQDTEIKDAHAPRVGVGSGASFAVVFRRAFMGGLTTPLLERST